MRTCLEGPLNYTVKGIAVGGSIKKETHAYRQHLKHIPTTWKCFRSLHPFIFLGIVQPIRREPSLSVSPNIQTGMLRFLKLWKWTGISIPGKKIRIFPQQLIPKKISPKLMAITDTCLLEIWSGLNKQTYIVLFFTDSCRFTYYDNQCTFSCFYIASFGLIFPRYPWTRTRVLSVWGWAEGWNRGWNHFHYLTIKNKLADAHHV